MADHRTSDVDRLQRDLDELERLRRWSRVVPTDPEVRLIFARKLLDCRRAEEAILEIRAVITMVPNHLEARKLLESAHALQSAGRTTA